MGFFGVLTCFGFLVVANIFIMLRETRKKKIYLFLNLLTIVGYLLFVSQFWNESKGNLVFIILNMCAVYYMGSYYFMKDKEGKKKNFILKNLDKIALIAFVFLIIEYSQ